VPGGVGEVWAAADAAGKTSLWVPLAGSSSSVAAGMQAFFTQPMNVPALLTALVVGRMAQYTSDQVLVQRLQTTATLRETRQAFVIHAAGDALWMIGLSVVGLALFAYFQHQPAPPGLPADRLLPYFMSVAFPAGALGLVIAAILAASLSSIDSAVHSCSSVLVVDVYHRWLRAGAARESGGDAASIRASRVATLLVGAAGTTLACNVARIGTLLEIANKLINAFTGPLFGMFILAMFSRRAGSTAALAAGLAGAAVSYGVAYQSPLGFLWPSTFGLLATVIVGAVVAMFTPAASPEKVRFTWREVMNGA
jgi:SSS family solute:Na+ symporter